MNKDIFGLMKFITLVLLAPILSLGFALLTFYIGLGIGEVIKFDFFIGNLIFVVPICFVLSPFVFLVAIPTISAIKNHWSKHLDWFFNRKLLMTMLLPIFCPIIGIYFYPSEVLFDKILKWIYGSLFLMILITFFTVLTIVFFKVKKKRKEEIFSYILFCISFALIFALIVSNSQYFIDMCFLAFFISSFGFLTVYLTVMGYGAWGYLKRARGQQSEDVSNE